MNFVDSDTLIEKIEETYRIVNLQLWNSSRSHLTYYFNKLKGDIPDIGKAVMHRNVLNIYTRDGGLVDWKLQKKINSNYNYNELISIIVYIRGEPFGKQNLIEGFTLE